MKEILKILAIIELIGGAIAGFFFAKFYGVNILLSGDLERDWLLTIIIFVFILFCSFISFVILMAIYEILDNQHHIYEKLTQITAKIDKQVENEPSPNKWKCSKCGKYNMNYVGTCSCGNTK
ncbi:hypothetical protein [Clostridium sp. Marseille-P2415]|uniref:hypothetical protein n=1 Tax=Clostridium sp. Marseille-P2415 TaxID=1805471 RepID=UPI0009884F7B|nr:hypothetical protein [Clostridium sp. Marseille-P2415]